MTPDPGAPPRRTRRWRVSFAPMQLSDVAEVAAIEQSIYAAPWSEGNFVDSLNAGYCAWTLRSAPSHRAAVRRSSATSC